MKKNESGKNEANMHVVPTSFVSFQHAVSVLDVTCIVGLVRTLFWVMLADVGFVLINEVHNTNSL